MTCAGGSSRVFSRALKALVEEHVHLVDHEDLETITSRSERDVIDDHFAHIIDSGV